MWTTPFERFVAPARARPQIWRLLLGLMFVLTLYVAFIVLLLGAVWAATGRTGLAEWLQAITRADTPTAVLLMLATFAGMFVGPLIAARLLHGRRARGLFGAAVPRAFLGAAAITVSVFALATIAFPWPFEMTRNLPLPLFASFLPLALLALLLQTGAEELLFRGYLQSQLAARFQSPLVWMLLPAIAFGALHYDPAGAGGNAIWLVASATLFGLLAADLTRVTGGIGAAWGVHFVNNASAMLIVSIEGSLSGLSLWTTPMAVDAIPATLLAQDMALTFIVWACIRLRLARRDARTPRNT